MIAGCGSVSSSVFATWGLISNEGYILLSVLLSHMRANDIENGKAFVVP